MVTAYKLKSIVNSTVVIITIKFKKKNNVSQNPISQIPCGITNCVNTLALFNGKLLPWMLIIIILFSSVFSL